MADGLQVIILGAGCSKFCDYPLATETREHFRAFAAFLEEEPRKSDSPRLLRLENQTLEVFDRETLPPAEWEAVEKSVDRALTWLSANQQLDGSYYARELPTCFVPDSACFPKQLPRRFPLPFIP